MIGLLIHVLIVLLVLVVVWWVVRLVAAHLGLPAVAVQVVGAILALILLLYILQVFGLTPHWRGP